MKIKKANLLKIKKGMEFGIISGVGLVGFDKALYLIGLITENAVAYKDITNAAFELITKFLI